ncbi:hypothetical protein MNBD_GAMMA12-2226 [hydrothermal vent metagenome]|uniref:Uncharacterized protein n=1 Tax=hydrothermal vent metagenome TaxID=652676 RepID=A0A3B0ZLF6_9ZZZZ
MNLKFKYGVVKYNSQELVFLQPRYVYFWKGMNKDFRTIGGWLRVFQIFTIIGIVFLPMVGLYVLYLYFSIGYTDTDYLNLALLSAEALPGFVFSILIFRIIGSNNESTPQLINNMLAFMVLLAVVITIVLFQSGLAIRPQPILIDLVYYFIWTRYFNKSKRVFEFYGANAGPKVISETAVNEKNT